MLTIIVAIVCMIVGAMIGAGLVLANTGFLLSVLNCKFPWRVHFISEVAVETMKSLCSDAQYSVILAKVRKTRVKFIDGAFNAYQECKVNAGRDNMAIHGIAIFKNTILISSGDGWEDRLGRAIVHLAHMTIHGNPDSSMTDNPGWFRTVNSTIHGAN